MDLAPFGKLPDCCPDAGGCLFWGWASAAMGATPSDTVSVCYPDADEAFSGICFASSVRLGMGSPQHLPYLTTSRDLKMPVHLLHRQLQVSRYDCGRVARANGSNVWCILRVRIHNSMGRSFLVDGLTPADQSCLIDQTCHRSCFCFAGCDFRCCLGSRAESLVPLTSLVVDSHFHIAHLLHHTSERPDSTTDPDAPSVAYRYYGRSAETATSGAWLRP